MSFAKLGLRQGKCNPSRGQPSILPSSSTILTRGTRPSRPICFPRVVSMTLASQTCHRSRFPTMTITTTTVMASFLKKSASPSSIMRRVSQGAPRRRPFVDISLGNGSSRRNSCPSSQRRGQQRRRCSGPRRSSASRVPPFRILLLFCPFYQWSLSSFQVTCPSFRSLSFHTVWSAHMLMRSSLNILSLLSLTSTLSFLYHLYALH